MDLPAAGKWKFSRGRKPPHGERPKILLTPYVAIVILALAVATLMDTVTVSYRIWKGGIVADRCGCSPAGLPPAAVV